MILVAVLGKKICYSRSYILVFSGEKICCSRSYILVPGKKMIFTSVSRSVNRCTDRRCGVSLVFFFCRRLKMLNFFCLWVVKREIFGRFLQGFFIFRELSGKEKRQTTVENTLLENSTERFPKSILRHRKSLKLLFFLFRRWRWLSPSMYTSNCKTSVIPISVSFLDLRISITSIY